MRVVISGLRRIRQADIELAGQTMVCGPNGAGKSTICLAIAAAATGIASPITLKGRGNDHDLMLTDGAKEGSVTLAHAGGSSTLSWPSGQHTTEGAEPPRASVIAAGLRRFMAGRLDDRARLFAETFHALPSDDELRAALTPVLAYDPPDEPATAKLVDAVVARVSRDGWDAAAAFMGEQAKHDKGRWSEVTGAKWGSDKAGSWVPKGLRPDVPLETLEAELAAATQAHADAIAAAAVSGDRLQQLEAAAALLPAASEAFAAAERRANECAQQLQFAGKTQRDKEAASRGQAPIEVACPHCDETLYVVGTVAHKHIPPAPAQADLSLWADAVADATRQHTAATADLAEKKAAFNAASRAAQELSTARKDGAAPKGAHPVDRALAMMNLAREALEAAQKLDRAEVLRWNVEEHLAIKQVLDPDGLRQTKAREVLDTVNSTLADMSSAMRCLPVSIGPDMNLSLGTRPYAGLSEAEAMRADFIVQTFIATADGSDLLIFDRAGTLDTTGRRGLMDMLLKFWPDRPAVIGMTYGKRELVPPVEQVGGVGYWIDDKGRVSRARPAQG
jgi:hypothetical protein